MNGNTISFSQLSDPNSFGVDFASGPDITVIGPAFYKPRPARFADGPLKGKTLMRCPLWIYVQKSNSGLPLVYLAHPIPGSPTREERIVAKLAGVAPAIAFEYRHVEPVFSGIVEGRGICACSLDGDAYDYAIADTPGCRNLGAFINRIKASALGYALHRIGAWNFSMGELKNG